MHNPLLHRVAAKFSFSYFREIFKKFLISCFVKFSLHFANFKIILSKFCVSWNYQNAKFCSHPTLTLHNLPSAAHPPLPSARRFFNAARKCFFEMKKNKELYFSILSSIILWSWHSLIHYTSAYIWVKFLIHLLIHYTVQY